MGGGYTYLRAPMGLTSSGDIFCARTDEALAGIPGVHKLVDDILEPFFTQHQRQEQHLSHPRYFDYSFNLLKV